MRTRTIETVGGPKSCRLAGRPRALLGVALAVAALSASISGCRSTTAPGSYSSGLIAIHDPQDLLDEKGRASLAREGEDTIREVTRAWGIPLPDEPVPVEIVSGGSRCGAGPDGITLQVHHIPLQDLSHELVHYLCGDAWRMVSEGLAMHFTEAFAQDVTEPDYVTIDARALAYIQAGVEIDLTAAGCAEAMPPRAYVQAGSLVGYLVRTYGPGPVRAFYEGPPDGYESAFGRDRATVLAAWRASLKDRVIVGSPRFTGFLRQVQLWKAGALEDDPG